jgi:hypothetical protein
MQSSAEIGLQLVGAILPAVHLMEQRSLTDETLVSAQAREDALLIRLRLQSADVASLLTDAICEAAVRTFIRGYVALQQALPHALHATAPLRSPKG